MDKPNLQFSIYHFAGKVNYSAAGFVSKNKDQLRPEISTTMLQSGDAFVVDIFNLGTGAPAANPVAGPRNTTLTSQFRQQLNALAEVLGVSPYFVRCIKPREPLHSGLHFDENKVAWQLACAGVLETVRVKMQGWNVRLLLTDFNHQVARPAIGKA